MAAALQHRGITVVHDFGESDGVLYLVMELLDGRNLSQLLEDNKQHPLPVAGRRGDRRAGRRRPRLLPRAGHRPPRPEAREHRAARRRHGEDLRLRHRPPRPRHRLHLPADRHRHRHGHPALHVPGADQRHRGRPAQRPVLVRAACSTRSPPAYRRSTSTTPGRSSSATATPRPGRRADTAPNSPSTWSGSSSTCWPRNPGNDPTTPASWPAGSARTGPRRPMCRPSWRAVPRLTRRRARAGCRPGPVA